MQENHQREQYFYTPPTRARLAGFLQAYSSVCLLCAPTLGQEIEAAGRDVTVLDLDERFSALKGFRRWDLYRPQALGARFDLIFCDPPFYKVSLAQLFAAIRVLARGSFDQPLLMSHLIARAQDVTATFAPFDLARTGYSPDYVTVDQSGGRTIEVYGNLGAEAHLALQTGVDDPPSRPGGASA